MKHGLIYKTRRLLYMALIAVALSYSCPIRGGDKTERQDNSFSVLQNVYLRLANNYAIILWNDHITADIRRAFSEEAYVCLFEYWVIAVSHNAKVPRMPAFECLYFQLVFPRLAPDVSREDPLRIRRAYSGGKYRQDVFPPDVFCVDPDMVSTWGKYQSLVSGFQSFVEETRAKIPPDRLIWLKKKK